MLVYIHKVGLILFVVSIMFFFFIVGKSFVHCVCKFSQEMYFPVFLLDCLVYCLWGFFLGGWGGG
jgi:hypothetical protein